MANPPTLVGIGAAGIANGAATGAVSVALPTGVVAGDVLVAFYMVGDSGHTTSTPVVPSGWSTPGTGESGTVLTSAYGWTTYVSYKIAGSSEPASYSFSVASISGAAYTYAQMVAFSGNDATNGVDGLASLALYTSGTTLTIGSKTPTNASDVWLSFLYDWSTTTAPSLAAGWTNIATGSNSALYVSTRAEYENLSSTSPTGTATSTSSGGFNIGSDQPGAAFSVLIKGASSTGDTATGSAITTLTASGAAQSKQQATGSATLSVVAAATAAALVGAQIAAAIAPSAAGTQQATNPAVTASATQTSAAGTANASQSAQASATVHPGADATTQASQLAVGGATIVPTASGTVAIAALNSAQGAVTIQPSATGTAAAIQAAAASSTVDPSAQGSVQASQTVQATATIRPTASGTVQLAGINTAVGGATIIPSASGSAQASQTADGSATVRPSLQAFAQALNPAQASCGTGYSATGTLSATVSASVVGRIVPQASGTWAGWQSAAGVSLIEPSASATVRAGNAYATNPQFYLQMPARAFTVAMPARAFTVAMPARAFYAAMPARSFYLQDDASMPAQTFPDAMDPAEVQVLTIDGTPDLASGETLSSLAGSLVVEMVRGIDTQAASRFGTPQINVATIAADPPTIQTTVAAGKGLQIAATQPQDGCWYLFRQPCLTSAGRTVTLKGILQVTSS